MKSFLLSFFLLLIVTQGSAQSIDSAAIRRKVFKKSFFFGNDSVTRNDYLVHIGEVSQILNKISLAVPPQNIVEGISSQLNRESAILHIIKERVSSGERRPRVRNLQMYDILSEQMKKQTDANVSKLNEYDSTLSASSIKAFNYQISITYLLVISC